MGKWGTILNIFSKLFKTQNWAEGFPVTGLA